MDPIGLGREEARIFVTKICYDLVYIYIYTVFCLLNLESSLLYGAALALKALGKFGWGAPLRMTQ
jgi:hypothetical protein